MKAARENQCAPLRSSYFEQVWQPPHLSTGEECREEIHANLLISPSSLHKRGVHPCSRLIWQGIAAKRKSQHVHRRLLCQPLCVQGQVLLGNLVGSVTHHLCACTPSELLCISSSQHGAQQLAHRNPFATVNWWQKGGEEGVSPVFSGTLYIRRQLVWRQGFRRGNTASFHAELCMRDTGRDGQESVS